MAKKDRQPNRPIEIPNFKPEIQAPTFKPVDPRFRKSDTNRYGGTSYGKIVGMENSEAMLVSKTWEAIGGAIDSTGTKMYEKQEEKKKEDDIAAIQEGGGALATDALDEKYKDITAAENARNISNDLRMAPDQPNEWEIKQRILDDSRKRTQQQSMELWQISRGGT